MGCSFSTFGLHVYNTCRRSIYEKKNDSDFKVFFLEHRSQNENVVEKTDSEDNPEHDEISDPTFQCHDSDEAEKIEKINSVLREFGEPPIKKPRVEKLSHKEEQMLSQTFSKITSENNGFDDNDSETLYIRDIRAALSQQNDQAGKIQILTTLPQEWTIAKIRRELNVSRRTASKAKKIRNKSGYGSRPNKKGSRHLPITTVNAVKNFYLADDNSRIMPGMKDCISIVKDGKRRLEQKRLLFLGSH